MANTQPTTPTLLDQIKTSPLIWYSCAFAAGMLAAAHFQYHWLVWVVVAVAALIFSLLAKKIQPALSLFILIIPVIFLAGAARYQSGRSPFSESLVSHFNDLGQHVYITGMVGQAPDLRDKVINLRVEAQSIDLGVGDSPASGTVLVKLYNEYPVHYGDLVRVYGTLQTPPESADFSYRDYLARQGVFSLLTTDSVTVLRQGQGDPARAMLIASQASIQEKTRLLFQPPVAALVSGILIGQDQEIPADVEQAFINTGTSHIVAISGFNIGIVSFIFILAFSRLFGKRVGTAVSILGILVYTILAGAEPSLVRAAIMGVLGAVGVLIGRRNATLTALFVAALLMQLQDEMVLWQVGFQLSFSATLGIVLITPPLQQKAREFFDKIAPPLWADRIVSLLSDVLIVTLAAQVFVLPFILYHFGRLPLVTFVANPLILPLQPALMILSGLAVAASYLFVPLGQLVALLAHPFGAATIAIVEILSPYQAWSISFGNFTSGFALLYLAGLLLLAIFWPSIKRSPAPSWLIPLLLAVAFVMWDSVAKMPDGRLHITVLDVGSADGYLIQAPTGRSVLINGGDVPSALLDQVGRRTSLFNKEVDLLIIASTQENQLAALPRFTSMFAPKEVLWAGNRQASYSSMKLRDQLTDWQIPIQQASPGQWVDLGNGALIRILAVTSRGAVLRLEMGQFSMLLPIGVNRDSFEQLEFATLAQPVTVYAFAESGYGPSNPLGLISAVAPQWFVLPISATDSRGYPSANLMEAIDNPNILRTDEHGWIEISTDGTLVEVRTAR